MRPLVIFDLDGTIADIRHRIYMVKAPNHNWTGFYEHCVLDAPMPATIAVAKALYAAGHDLWLFSGRSDEVHNLTCQWLETQDIAQLFARSRFRVAGDYTPDDVLKRRWYNEMSEQDRARLMLVFDDRDRLVAMWRALGVPCFQVAPGDF